MEKKDAWALAFIAVLLAVGFAGVGLANLVGSGASGLALTVGCLGLALLCLLAAGWMVRPPRERSGPGEGTVRRRTAGRTLPMPRDVQQIIAEFDRTKGQSATGTEPTTAGRR